MTYLYDDVLFIYGAKIQMIRSLGVIFELCLKVLFSLHGFEFSCQKLAVKMKCNLLRSLLLLNDTFFHFSKDGNYFFSDEEVQQKLHSWPETLEHCKTVAVDMKRDFRLHFPTFLPRTSCGMQEHHLYKITINYHQHNRSSSSTSICTLARC